MNDYLLTCLLINIFVLIAIQGLKNAPARLSFALLIVGLLSWFMPWQLFSQMPLLTHEMHYSLNLASFTPQAEIAVTNQAAAHVSSHNANTFDFTLPAVATLFMFALWIGACLFIWRITHYLKFVQQLEKNAESCSTLNIEHTDYPIKVTKLTGPAIATGLFNPVIWLDQSMMNRDELTSVIEHERTHLKQGDMYWIWLICCVESFFWWNPLCLKLASLARQQLEICCDERCIDALKEQYQLDLASLLLHEHTTSYTQSYFTPPLLNIAHSKSFNIQRIKMLNKEKTMKTKYLILVTTAMSFSALAATQIVDSKATQKQSTAQVQQQATESEQYQAQMALLLEGVKGAKSEDTEQLQQAVNHIIQWHQNRTRLTQPEEAKLKLLSFTLVSHLYSKLGQFDDVLTTYEKWYESGSHSDLFLKNIIATAYFQLGRYELAIKELEMIQNQLGDGVHPGTLMNLARVHIEAKDFDKALSVLSHPNAGDAAYTNMLRYYVYAQQNDTINMAALQSKIPAQFAKAPTVLPSMGIPNSPLLKLI